MVKRKDYNASQIIDNYIKKNKKGELERKIILETWIDDNRTSNAKEIIQYIKSSFNAEDSEYLIRAYYLPKSIIEDAIEKCRIYDSFVAEWVISNLIIQYATDRKTVLTRIEDVIVINQLQEESNNKKDSKMAKKLKKTKSCCIKL